MVVLNGATERSKMTFFHPQFRLELGVKGKKSRKPILAVCCFVSVSDLSKTNDIVTKAVFVVNRQTHHAIHIVCADSRCAIHEAKVRVTLWPCASSHNEPLWAGDGVC